jgi:hypothetical protein
MIANYLLLCSARTHQHHVVKLGSQKDSVSQKTPFLRPPRKFPVPKLALFRKNAIGAGKRELLLKIRYASVFL